MKLMVDFFSGFGGASEAFARATDWTVLRYDNNPELRDVPLTIMADILNDEIRIRHHIDLFWASPECREFSYGYHAPGPKSKREGIEFQPCMKQAEKVKEFIEENKPTHWVVENVKGSVPYFKELFGEPRQIIGPVYLYGNFPLIHLPKDFKHIKDDAWSTTPLRYNIRSKIPLEISRGLLESIESQKTLFEF
tara:strand:+ start:1376 stop:1954 length:579 start_codon:yes stop_codon:yes gene_type:complete